MNIKRDQLEQCLERASNEADKAADIAGDTIIGRELAVIVADIEELLCQLRDEAEEDGEQ